MQTCQQATQDLQPINWNQFATTVILEVRRGSHVFTGSGVLINQQALLTAAHVIDCADEVRVLITHDYKCQGRTFFANRCYIHPEYAPSQSLYENDLALVFLQESIELEFIYDEIAGHFGIGAGEELERIGFGARDNQNKRAWTNPKFQELSFSRRTMVLSDQLSFIGDSGGPIYQTILNERKLVGIHSTREVGGRTYAINLANYKDWVESLLDLA